MLARTELQHLQFLHIARTFGDLPHHGAEAVLLMTTLVLLAHTPTKCVATLKMRGIS